MLDLIIKNGLVLNEGNAEYLDIGIRNGRIELIDNSINQASAREITAEGKWVMPGIIDDQVHFREPGLTHKATIETESKAALAGGITSFMEMPNTKPPALTQERLEEKYQIGAATSWTNFSFYMGSLK